MDFKGLPIYKASVKEDDTLMYCISLVEQPATEANFLVFEADKQPMEFAVQDEDKHLVFGLVMGCNQPIYRRLPNGFEFYITYDAETIRLMAEKYFKAGYQENVDTDHNNELVDGVNMIQFFIKDTEKGINPKGFEDYADGSLFAEYKVNNEEIWEGIKNGKFNGFSLAGMFDIEPVEDENAELEEIYELIEKINKKLNK